MNNKGQALVEFVLVLPVLLIIFMYMFDIFKIVSYKTDIENDMNVVVSLYHDSGKLNDYLISNGIEFSSSTDNNLTTIRLKKSTHYAMPLVSRVLGSDIESERVIYEQ